MVGTVRHLVFFSFNFFEMLPLVFVKKQYRFSVPIYMPNVEIKYELKIAFNKKVINIKSFASQCSYLSPIYL